MDGRKKKRGEEKKNEIDYNFSSIGHELIKKKKIKKEIVYASIEILPMLRKNCNC